MSFLWNSSATSAKLEKQKTDAMAEVEMMMQNAQREMGTLHLQIDDLKKKLKVLPPKSKSAETYRRQLKSLNTRYSACQRVVNMHMNATTQVQQIDATMAVAKYQKAMVHQTHDQLKKFSTSDMRATQRKADEIAKQSQAIADLNEHVADIMGNVMQPDDYDDDGDYDLTDDLDDILVEDGEETFNYLNSAPRAPTTMFVTDAGKPDAGSSAEVVDLDDF